MTAAAKPKQEAKGWRDVLPIHPAADLFPLMGKSEFREFAADIDANSLQERVDVWPDPQTGKVMLLDGRNRLDALELNGHDLSGLGRIRPNRRGYYEPGHYYLVIGQQKDFDPYRYVIS